MTWQTQLARLNASLVGEARGFGEPCSLYLAGYPADAAVSAILGKTPSLIGETDAWEELTVAWVQSADCPRDPRAGDGVVEGAGPRWIVDRATLTDGLWSLTLRKDPAG
jgi:hypothetical protein